MKFLNVSRRLSQMSIAPWLKSVVLTLAPCLSKVFAIPESKYLRLSTTCQFICPWFSGCKISCSPTVALSPTHTNSPGLMLSYYPLELRLQLNFLLPYFYAVRLMTGCRFRLAQFRLALVIRAIPHLLSILMPRHACTHVLYPPRLYQCTILW